MKLTIKLICLFALFTGFSGKSWRYPFSCPNDEYTSEGLWASCNLTDDCALGYFCAESHHVGGGDYGFCQREKCFSDRNCKFSEDLFCYKTYGRMIFGVCCETDELKYN